MGECDGYDSVDFSCCSGEEKLIKMVYTGNGYFKPGEREEIYRILGNVLDIRERRASGFWVSVIGVMKMPTDRGIVKILQDLEGAGNLYSLRINPFGYTPQEQKTLFSKYLGENIPEGIETEIVFQG